MPADARYPLLVKVREGFGSRHIYRAEDAEQLAFFLGYTPVESFVQQVCLGEEFSIDVFCDTEGRCLNAIPRTMIQSKGGESIKGMTIKDAELIEHGCRVAEAIGIVGPANIQCFREPDGSLPVTDVNPRFGGAFPLPRAAGSRYPGARARARARRAAGAADRRLPRGRLHDPVLLAPQPDGERRRPARPLRRGAARPGRGRPGRFLLALSATSPLPVRPWPVASLPARPKRPISPALCSLFARTDMSFRARSEGLSPEHGEG